MNRKLHWFAALLAFSATGAHAGVTADEAKALGTTLTAIGAEKAGNTAGTIPAYSGGLTTAPAGFKPGDGLRPDPFAAEKPRLQIDAKNMATHAAQLTEGTKALLQKYPTYRVDVYPTHRTVAFPKFVTDNTAKAALAAKTLNDGRSIEGAHAGLSVPDPEDRQRGDVEPPGPLQRPGLRGQVPQPHRRRERPRLARHRGRQHPGIPVLGQQQDGRRDLLAHQADLHRTGASRRRGADDRRPARHRHQGSPRLDLSARPAPHQGRPRPRATTRRTRARPARRRSTTPSSSTARWTASTSSWSARRRCTFPTTPTQRSTRPSRTSCSSRTT